MLFDIPVIFDKDYHRFIAENQKFIHSIYFGLPTKIGLDARNVVNTLGVKEFISFLEKIPKGIKRYVTLNGRYTPLHHYSEDAMRTVADFLEKLEESGNVTGILILDFFYLQRLIDVGPGLMKRLEIVPSVNFNLDSIDRINALHEYLSFLNCRPASKIILDRSLNRRYLELDKIVKYCRNKFPHTKIEMIANEGCLYQCPYKINHDIFISLAGDYTLDNYLYLSKIYSHNDFDIKSITEKYACIKYYSTAPEKMLKSPFIRPEDIDRYDADVIKISCRARDINFLKQTFCAYKNRRWSGSVIQLMDAMFQMSDKYYISNEKMPADFWRVTSHCNKDCAACGYCKEVFDALILERA